MGLILDIDKLIAPYRETGSKTGPKRSLTTIISKLIYSNGINPEIAGAACLKVFYKMAHDGLVFNGDGTAGSPGRELYSCIKAQAVDLAKRDAVDKTMRAILTKTSCTRVKCPKRTTELKKLSRFDRFKVFLLKPRGWWRL